VAHVVEGHHLVVVAQQHVGEAVLVGPGDGDARLEEADRVPGDVADQPTGEGRSAGHAHRGVAHQRGPDGVDGIGGVAQLPAQQPPRAGAQEGEAGAPLAALDRLEQEGVRVAARELEEGRDRGLGVGVDLHAHRDGAPRSAELQERREVWLGAQISAKATPSCRA
jgi:hypothetical protein